MILSISDKEEFLASFLQPVSRITDSGVIKITSDGISSVAATADDTIIVSGTYRQAFPEVTAPLTLNVPDLKKLVKLLVLVSSPIQLVIGENSISYNSSSVRFKYHLYEDGILTVPSLNMSKLKAIVFDTTFNIHSNELSSLMKGSTLNAEVNKVYLNTTATEVIAELTNKGQANVDSFSLQISPTFTGPPITIPVAINFEIMRLLNGSKLPSFNVQYSSKLKIFNFELNSTAASINYIVSTLVSA